MTVQSTLKSKSYCIIFKVSTCCAIHVRSKTFSSEQSKGMDWKNTPTHPCPSRSKVILCPLRVSEGRAERTTMKASDKGKDSVYRHTKPPARRHACDGRHMWWRTHKSTRTNFGMCIWTELSILTVCAPKATEQNKPCKGLASISLADVLAGNNPTTL